MSAQRVEVDTEGDHADKLFDVQLFLRGAAEEYTNLVEQYAALSKQCEDGRKPDDGHDKAALRRILVDVIGEKAIEGTNFKNLAKNGDRFLKDLPVYTQMKDLRLLVGVFSYLTFIRRSPGIISGLKIPHEIENWRNFIHLLLNELDANLLQSPSTPACLHLSKWINQHVSEWRKNACSEVSAAIADRLESATIPQDSLHADKRLLEQIRPLAQILLDISLSDMEELEPYGTVADALLRPFVKRFIHHFHGGDQRRDKQSMVIKPEWYLSMIIKWHREYAPWIEKLDLEGRKEDEGSETEAQTSSSLAVVFSRRLVQLARNRFKADILHYSQDETSALPHLIDEAISFDSDMKTSGYPENEVGCVDVLTEPGIFELWAQLEQQEANKCLDAFFNDQDAWLLRYGENVSFLGDANVDSFKVPIVTDNVLVLLSAMKHRFRFVRSQEHRRVFVQIQCTLLHDFRDRLCDFSQDLHSPISSSASDSKDTPTFAHLVNSCTYVSAVLTEWQNIPEYSTIKANCFGDIVDLFDHTKRSLFRDACSAVLRDLQPSIDEYRRSFSQFTGRDDIQFSGQATPHLYTPMQESLSILNRTLSKKNFSNFVHQLASGLEKMLIDRVVLELRLDQKSGEELQRHLGKAFVRMCFENYGFVGARTSFARLMEYLHLAAMNAGNCTLLKEALKERRIPPEEVMNEMGLKHISAREAEELLQRRSDLM